MESNTAAPPAQPTVAKINYRSLIKETLMKAVFAIAAVLFIAAVILICVYLFARAIPGITEIGWVNFLFGSDWALGMDLFGVGGAVGSGVGIGQQLVHRRGGEQVELGPAQHLDGLGPAAGPVGGGHRLPVKVDDALGIAVGVVFVFQAAQGSDGILHGYSLSSFGFW